MPDLLSRRKLPKDAQLMHVYELFALTPEDQDRVLVWLGGDDAYSSWMRATSLLARPHPTRAAHLSSCPSSMVIVVKWDAA